MDKNLENQVQLKAEIGQVFDNPLTHGILTKNEVAQVLRKKPGTIIHMANRGSLPCHYIGDTMMFYLHEIIDAFLSDRLANRRRKEDANHSQKESENQARMVRSASKNSRQAGDEELRSLAASFGLD